MIDCCLELCNIWLAVDFNFCVLLFIYCFLIYRAEEKVLALSNEIKDIQDLKSQITDDKLQSLQKQKSLESALAKKTSE